MKKHAISTLLAALVLAVAIALTLCSAFRQDEPVADDSVNGVALSEVQKSAPAASASDEVTVRPLIDIAEPQENIPLNEPVEAPTLGGTFPVPAPSVEGDRMVWVFSEVADFFIVEEGYDPEFIIKWIPETAERRDIELVVDVDPQEYMKYSKNEKN